MCVCMSLRFIYFSWCVANGDVMNGVDTHRGLERFSRGESEGDKLAQSMELFSF